MRVLVARMKEGIMNDEVPNNTGGKILADEMSIEFRPVVNEIQRKERRYSAVIENTRKRQRQCIEICGVKVDARTSVPHQRLSPRPSPVHCTSYTA
jgi:hypothetical protein